MSHVFFATELEGVATWWRIERKDGITLGFTSHDRDLTFDGLTHRAAPGILPSAIRKTAALDGDSAEMHGPLSHGSISTSDLAAGRFDSARVSIGAVDWETLERTQLYAGSIGIVSEEENGFNADLLSAKAQLEADIIPRTSPTCRATFCGPGCTLSAQRFTTEAVVTGFDAERFAIRVAGVAGADYAFGSVRWLEGSNIGLTTDVIAVEGDELTLDAPLPEDIGVGTKLRLRQGCDHTLATCNQRFGNSANFQGEPFLPGNDLLSRYPSPQ